MPLTGKLARIFNLPQESGLLVQRVVKVSPFGVLGLQDGDTEITVNDQKLIVGGDIILEINGIKFEDRDESLLAISETFERNGSNSQIELKVLRGGKIITLGRK